MKKIIEYLIAYMVSLALWFRYRIRVEGFEKLTPEALTRSGGILFLPNHPAYFVDPCIATLAVWPKFPIRPMIIEYMYYTPGIHTVMHVMNALPVPNFVNSSNSLKKKKGEKVIQTIISDVKKGENFLIYPAGKVKHAAREAVGGSSAVQKILQEAPEANVVLVRIKGLWGSSFSRALEQPVPTFGGALLMGLKIILKNLILFTPRREVVVKLEPAPADFPRDGTRMEINKYLEDWYNRPDGLVPQDDSRPGDSLMLVSYSRWKEEYSLPKQGAHGFEDEDIKLSDIPQEIQQKVAAKLAELTEMSVSSIKPDLTLATDLGLDSLDTAEVVVFLNDQFDITGISAKDLTTVLRVMAIAAGKFVSEHEAEEEQQSIKKWNRKRVKRRAELATGSTLAEVFLNRCAINGNEVACADERVGVQTYAQLRMRAILLAEKIMEMPGKYIGIMLPASVAANLLIMACQIAGKVPLMVNWTVGPRHLDSVVKVSGVEVVISSWAFLDRLENVDLNGVEDRLVMIEDIVRRLSLIDKLTALYHSKRSTRAVMKHFRIDQVKPESEAVLLFTSGTESMPKGVPLSHKNILSNLKAALSTLELLSSDVIYGILPPFHSFGFTVSGIAGLFSGMRVFYSPNPTDGKRLARGLERWGVTIMCGAPTFIKGLLKAAIPEQIKSMRLCLTGAEKAPPELFQMLTQYGKNGCLVEGYGITECSPILTVSPFGLNPKGVGRALPGVDLCIVNPETEKPVSTGERGLILVRGPNVFNGYINPGLSSPFTTIEGTTWYKTGDLGYFDESGILTISGRMKRFVKMGGEMVSLAAVEEALLHYGLEKGWPTSQEGPAMAICAKEFPNEKTKIILFSCFEITVDEVNKALKESGFSNLVKVSAVVRLQDIPIMGTGKVNYRLLESEHLPV